MLFFSKNWSGVQSSHAWKSCGPQKLPAHHDPRLPKASAKRTCSGRCSGALSHPTCSILVLLPSSRTLALALPHLYNPRLSPIITSRSRCQRFQPGATLSSSLRQPEQPQWKPKVFERNSSSCSHCSNKPNQHRTFGQIDQKGKNNKQQLKQRTAQRFIGFAPTAQRELSGSEKSSYQQMMAC